MHFEFLTEDRSSGEAMEILIPKLLGNDSTHNVHSYKGLGRIPKGLKAGSDPKKRILLNQLPRLLQGYGKNPHSGTIVIICDLDDRDKHFFLAELQQVLETCNPKPTVVFCIAIEEFEAWYLGDLNAVRNAFPHAKNSVLSEYTNDSICGTWEVLADAVYKGGSKPLAKKGWQAVGAQKSIWAKSISPHMNVDNNRSPSFNAMREHLKGTAI